ncbi:hemicentin-1 isoform X3 [Frankliniella occidentalis]|uniref:Hemicentin-1 isoform X3 n=1 Tax=Frankliniella occidentalis TaxID=133901 RepID=A0A9C6TWA7_FRAOC|nr:hemicentin-1 isoform X3 [Frankliniella occidentalis]
MERRGRGCVPRWWCVVTVTAALLALAGSTAASEPGSDAAPPADSAEWESLVGGARPAQDEDDVMLADEAATTDDALWNALVAAPGTASTAAADAGTVTEVSDSSDIPTPAPARAGPRAAASAPASAADAVSLAFVFDSTGSMWRDLEQLKRGAAAILEAMLARPDKPIYDYVFVPFNDPNVGPATVTTSADVFRAQMEAVQVRGGGDCPEPSLEAILQALKRVRPNSYVYVFTDASAKDHFLLPEVLSLVQRKQTQVVFVMTGNCKDSNTPRYQSMENIAVASSGQIYHINKAEVEDVLSFVQQTLDSQKVNLVSVDLPEAAKKEHAVQVDETIREFTVSVSGVNPHISVVNPDGVRIDQPPALQNILDLDNVKVVVVNKPLPGSWTVETSSDSKHAVRLTGISVVDFSYGFSVLETDRLNETYHRPLQDAPNFILVGGTDMGSVWNLTSVDLLDIDGSTLQTIPLSPLGALDGLYRGGQFIPPGGDQLFYLANFGYGKDGSPIKRITPTAISAQSGGLPVIQLQAEPRVWLNDTLTLRCQIDSLIPFSAWFSKNRIPISKKQKYQQTALMTMRIDSLTEEMGGDYVCHASNVQGFSKDVAHVTVSGPPPEVITDTQILVQPNHPAVLDCHVRSRLKFNMTWTRVNTQYSNDAELVDNNARYIILSNSSLVIDPAMPEDTGLFSCTAVNQGGKGESRINLLVSDPLKVTVHPRITKFQRGNSFTITCDANSLPTEFYWEHDGHILERGRMGHVIIEAVGLSLILRVTNAQLTDQGVFRCVAMNSRESVEEDAETYYEEIPSVMIRNSSDMVRAGDNVLLHCVANGIPRPKMRWLWQGLDVKLLSTNSEMLDNGDLMIYDIKPENTGQFDCVAHNTVGEVKDSVNITVGYPPKIVTKPSSTLIEIQSSGSLSCNGSGVPDPVIHWERLDGKLLDSRRVQQDMSSGSLIFSGVEIDDGGVYICVLENQYGQLVLEGEVLVTGIVAPAFDKHESIEQNFTSSVGREIILSCPISEGNPPPLIAWYKDGNLIDADANLGGIYIQMNGSLKLSEANPKHSGNYKCEATNVGGSISRYIFLTVMDPPFLESPDLLNLTEKVGNNVLLPCIAYGTPSPEIQWLQGDNSPIALTERIFRTYEGLVMTEIQLSDAGTYTCKALNPVGSVNRSIYLVVQDPPHIVGESVMELVANVGDVVRLPCDATGEPSPEFIWSHNYDYLTFNDHILPGTNSDGLVITSVNISDGGEYLCSAVNDAGSANKTITITVQEHPSIEIVGPLQVTVTAGQSAKLSCKARGTPQPRIAWTFKGQPFVVEDTEESESGNTILSLTDLQESDSGSYVCTAYNLAGSDSKTVKLFVQVKPSIEPWQEKFKIMEGQELVLDCLMHGNPPPKGTWLKDGVVISSNGTTDNSVQYRISAKLSDAGNYECEAENEIGNSTRALEVTVLAPPRIKAPHNISIVAISGEDVMLDCVEDKFQGFPFPEITWTINGNPINFTQLSSDTDSLGHFYFQRILPSQSGQYVCQVSNEAGNGSRIFNIFVQETPSIQEEFLEKKTLMEGEDLSLPCTSSGIPTPKITWLFNNKSLNFKEDYVDLLMMNDNTLVIISAQANISGVFTCVARNEVGEDMQQTSIEVYVPPSMTGNGIIHKEVNEGDNVILTCPSSDASEIAWSQDGEPINFLANERSDEAHFKLLDGGKTLEIFESRSTDNGTYTCTASNPVGSKTATFFLEVLWAPFFEEFGVGKKNFTVVEGNNITFDCLSNGSPTPKVIWKFNETLPVTEHTSPGVVILPSSRHLLTIPVVRAHHDGIYKCKAINRLGFINKQFALHVIVPPYVDSEKEDNYEVLRGESVTLVCPVSGSPKPVFLWDYPSNFNPHFEWSNKKVEFLNHSQIMVIHDVDFSDGGVFMCNGSNQAGFKLNYFNISITEAPVILDTSVEEDLNVVKGATLLLQCNVRGQPLPDVQWTHNGHMISSDRTTERFDLDTSSVSQTLSIDFSGAKDSGKYVCHATNTRGTAEKVYRVRFQVAPQIDGRVQYSIEHVNALYGLPFSLHCLSIGEPSPSITWLKDGLPLIKNIDYLIGGGHGEILHFKHSHQQQSGNYTCEAKNSAGSVSKSFILDVLIPPFHPNNTEEIKESVLLHDSLSLQCDFRGNPDPKLLWMKGIEPISSSTSKGLQLSGDNHTLVITSAELNHSGRYSCLGTNEAGSAELMFHVKVLEFPHRNEAITRNFTTFTVKPLRRVMLLCAMMGSPSPSLTWFKDDSLLDGNSLNGSIQISSDGRQLHILSALQYHEGLYKCNAKNDVGSSDAFFQLKMDAKGDWGDWSDWSMCSVSCGFGTQERNRECLTFNCLGEVFETRPCFMSHCPINGGWSNWTEWSGCVQTCGLELQNRTRECNNPEPMYGGFLCEGEVSQSQICDLPPCPVDGKWSLWSDWSKCSVTCGAGLQTRWRQCNNPTPAHGGLECKGVDTDVSSCNDGPCMGAWSEWSDWTPCSATCGPGRRHRRRECASQWSDCIGDNKQYEYCKLRRCPGEGPRKANLHIRGNLNGYDLRDDILIVDLKGDDKIKRGLVSTRLHNVQKREVPLEPIVPLLVSPVSWNVAYEDNDARNGYSLTKGIFNQDSQIQFATGEEVKIKHIGHGVDESGQLKVDIEVIGEVPYVQPQATIVIQPFSENFVKTGLHSLHVASEGGLSADGNYIPYTLNSTVLYQHNNEPMPFLSEKMSTDYIESNYDPNLQEMQYSISTVISQTFDEDKCPEGFKLNAEHKHCEDIDECLSGSKCHSTQLCENLLGSYRCSCPVGFKALAIGSRCLDVNECLQEPPLCSNDCRNIPGSYLCICPPGTFLLEDRHSCSSSPYWDDPDDTYGVSDVNGEENRSEENPLSARKHVIDDDFPYPQEHRQAEEEWSCPQGLVWRNGLCLDQDECLEDPYICGEDETCLNMFKTFKCMHTPCGRGYKRDTITRDCLASCSADLPCPSGATYAERKVFIPVTVAGEGNEPGAELVHLSVSHSLIAQFKKTSHTKYYFGNNKGKVVQLRQDSDKCILHISKKLKAGKIYRVEVRGDTFSDKNFYKI